MEDKFLYKSHCELQITSEDLNLSFLLNDLDIIPTRFFNKGDHKTNKNSNSITYRHNSLWAFKTEQTEIYIESISHHIKELEEAFFHKKDLLNQYKTNNSLNVCIWVWIETDNAGIGIDLDSSDLISLYNLANNIRFSLICKNSF